MENIYQHLLSRHMDINLHKPYIDEIEGVATFPLWNLSGVMVGYQQYRPMGNKEEFNHPKLGKYYTYRNNNYPTISVWGVESLHLTPNIVFLTEGIFDACRLTSHGITAVAVLSNDPVPDLRNWLRGMGKVSVTVCDNDKAGAKLAKFGTYSEVVPCHDLGDASDGYVQDLIAKYRRYL